MREADAILGERRHAAQEELSSALQAGVETLSLARIANSE